MPPAQKWVKEEYLPTYAKENWQKNFVMLSTWNEYGEGTYLMPTAGENGFGYLDALREAYTDEKADKAVNTAPTAAQKTRINRMYPQYRHLLRRDGVVNEMADTSKLSAVASLEFTNKDGFGVANIEISSLRRTALSAPPKATRSSIRPFPATIRLIRSRLSALPCRQRRARSHSSSL